MAKLDLSSREAALVGGIGGPSLTPGSIEQSLLWRRVDKGQMPPSGPLSKEEKLALRSWIEAGAPWPGTLVERRAGLDWWSLQPLQAADAPEASEGWSGSDIDRWVFAGLKKAGLKPSPRADKRTLIRRLYFDLTGLPPEPEAVKAFLEDRSERAYEKLADRLLASPQYGEHWARHWLDLARYSESEGFERDQLRENVWKYRDYVIRALNGNMPYAQFARDQIAGDVVDEPTHESMLATGFLTMGPTDAIGLTSSVDTERESVREDMLEEMLGVVGQSFLGMTVNCARCHDHKFDPISQREYYRLHSALAGVWPSIGRNPDSIDPDPSSLPLQTPRERRDYEARIEPVRLRMQALEDRIAAIYREARPKAGGLNAPTPYARWTFDTDARSDGGGPHARMSAKARLDAGAFAPVGGAETASATTTPLPKEIREKTLEVWVRVNGKPTKAITLFEIRNRSGFRGASNDGIRFTGDERKQWENFSVGRFRSAELNGPAEDSPAGSLIQVAIVYREDDRIQLFRNGRPYGDAYLPEPGAAAARLQTYFAGDAFVRFTASEELHIEEARLYDRALSASELAVSFQMGAISFSPDTLRSRMDAARRAELEGAEALLAEQRKSLAEVPAPEQAWIAAVRPAAPSRVLRRGDVRSKGDIVAPGGIAAIRGPAANFALAADAPDAAKRRALADWISSESNPLFWRVIVNRVWHHHFGAGLVENPNDFGYNGGLPSHPELLDYLAIKFRAGGGHLKELHREIVLSEAYRQASSFNAEAAKVDAGNRLLWRFSPRRLSGEAVRDAMLSVSGRLNLKMYGKSFQPFTADNTKGSYRTYRPAESDDAEHRRRSIYRMSVITAGHPMLEAFDCPLPAVKTPKRASTTTALQALSLMNNEFVQRQAQAMAARVRQETVAAKAGIERAFQLAIGRPPNLAEAADSDTLVRKHGLEALCWGLMNTSEFLYVE